MKLKDYYKLRNRFRKRILSIRDNVIDDEIRIFNRLDSLKLGQNPSIFLDDSSEEHEDNVKYAPGDSFHLINVRKSVRNFLKLSVGKLPPMEVFQIKKSIKKNQVDMHIITDLNTAMFEAENQVMVKNVFNYKIIFCMKLTAVLLKLARLYKHDVYLHYLYDLNEKLTTIPVLDSNISNYDLAMNALNPFKFKRDNITGYNWDKQNFYNQKNNIVIYITTDQSDLRNSKKFIQHMLSIKKNNNNVFIFTISPEVENQLKKLKAINKYINLENIMVNLNDDKIIKKIIKNKKNNVIEIRKYFLEYIQIPVIYILMIKDWENNLIDFIQNRLRGKIA